MKPKVGDRVRYVPMGQVYGRVTRPPTKAHYVPVEVEGRFPVLARWPLVDVEVVPDDAPPAPAPAPWTSRSEALAGSRELRGSAKRLRRNHSGDLDRMLLASHPLGGFDEPTEVFLNALELAHSALARGAELLYAKRPDYAEELDVLADGLAEYQESAAASLGEEGTDAGEGVDVELEFAEMFARRDDWQNPAEMAAALRMAAIDGGFDPDAMRRLPDAALLESAEEAHEKLRHRRQGSR